MKRGGVPQRETHRTFNAQKDVVFMVKYKLYILSMDVWTRDNKFVTHIEPEQYAEMMALQKHQSEHYKKKMDKYIEELVASKSKL